MKYLAINLDVFDNFRNIIDYDLHLASEFWQHTYVKTSVSSIIWQHNSFQIILHCHKIRLHTSIWHLSVHSSKSKRKFTRKMVSIFYWSSIYLIVEWTTRSSLLFILRNTCERMKYVESINHKKFFENLASHLPYQSQRLLSSPHEMENVMHTHVKCLYEKSIHCDSCMRVLQMIPSLN